MDYNATVMAALSGIEANCRVLRELLSGDSSEDATEPSSNASTDIQAPPRPCKHPAASRLDVSSFKFPDAWRCSICGFEGGK